MEREKPADNYTPTETNDGVTETPPAELSCLTEEEREALRFLSSINIPWAKEASALIRRLCAELWYLKNPSDGRCMEIGALRYALADRDRRIAEAVNDLRTRDSLDAGVTYWDWADEVANRLEGREK